MLERETQGAVYFQDSALWEAHGPLSEAAFNRVLELVVARHEVEMELRNADM